MLKDITPERFRCRVDTCPAVFTKCQLVNCPGVIDKGATLVIIGKRVTRAEHPELAGRIGEGECAIEISAELIREATKPTA